jgi:hypothetical protein
MSESPSTPFGDGRDKHGRFAPGNTGGPGNPLGGQVARLRSALVSAVSEEDMRDIIGTLVEKAKAGDVAAAKVVLERCLGRPIESDIIDRLEALERSTGHPIPNRKAS